MQIVSTTLLNSAFSLNTAEGLVYGNPGEWLLTYADGAQAISRDPLGGLPVNPSTTFAITATPVAPNAIEPAKKLPRIDFLRAIKKHGGKVTVAELNRAFGRATGWSSNRLATEASWGTLTKVGHGCYKLTPAGKALIASGYAPRYGGRTTDARI